MNCPSDLVVLGEDWGGHPSSTQHLVGRLTNDWTVIWVDSIGLRRPKLTRHDLTRVVSKLQDRFRTAPTAPAQPARSTPTVAATAGPKTIVSPLAIPVAANRFERSINRMVLGRQIKRSMQHNEMGRPVLWLSLPTGVDLVGSLGERAVVYYCGDDFSALAGVDHAPVARAERRLAERADVIFAASETLAKRFPPERTVLLPHGADTTLFGLPAEPAHDLPNDGRPIAGFYGTLADWIDTDLLMAAADSLADWWFVFVGPVRTDVSGLTQRPNVRLLGPRPHQALPGYVQHWTASMLPFRATPQIEACNPLKLREYLAAGRPVISTRFPAVEAYRDAVDIVTTGEGLVAALASARAEAGADDRSAFRRNRVAGESWDARAAQVHAVLRSL